MTSSRNIRYANDLITFYNPVWWGHDDPDADLANIVEWGTAGTEQFRDRILSSVVDAGRDGIELTFHLATIAVQSARSVRPVATSRIAPPMAECLTGKILSITTSSSRMFWSAQNSLPRASATRSSFR